MKQACKSNQIASPCKNAKSKKQNNRCQNQAGEGTVPFPFPFPREMKRSNKSKVVAIKQAFHLSPLLLT